MMKLLSRLLIFALALMLFFSPLKLYGGITGKINGRVTDAETGSGMALVNVMIAGTYIGTVTDEDGFYVLLNVSPGTYSITFKSIGYSTVTIRDVKVNIDLTTILNTQMHSEVLGFPEIVAIAKRPVVIHDISNSRLNIVSKQIENLPVESISQVVGLQAGIEGLTIRGSSPAQSIFLLDGISLNDERENLPYTALSLSSVKEIQVQTGGFNAEYGNARSGVINVISRDGRTDRYSCRATLRYSSPTPKNFGPSVYDPDTYFTRPFTDPAVCWTGTNNGVWDRYEQQQYVSFEGYNALSEMWLKDDDPTNDLTPSGIKRLWEWHHRRQGDIKKPDYTIDAGFGGPVPVIGKRLGDLRFFASYYRLQEMFIIPLVRDKYIEDNFRIKLTSDLNEKMKLTFSGLYGELHSVCPDQWQIPPSGSVLRSPEGIADRASAIEVIYMPDYYTPTDIYHNHFAIKFTHLLSEKTFYEANISHMINKYRTYATTNRDISRKFEILEGFFVDEAPYGYYPALSESSPGGYLSLGGWMGFGRDNTNNTTTIMKFDYTSQVNRFHQLKTGLEIVITDYNIHSALYHPYSMQWNHQLDRVSTPYRIGTYIQDKLEFEDFIMNVGVRFDFSDANSDWYDLEPYDTLFTSQYGDELEQHASRIKPSSIIAISPRLGVSHPITENSKLYFNYGHFNSLPSSEYRFQLDRSGFGQVKYLGDPSLPYSKTVAYELGFEQNLYDKYLLKLAAYYKDIVNQPSWTTYIDAEETVGVSKAGTDNYEDIRGFEFTLQKMYGGWFQGFINYTYMVNTAGYFGVRYLYENRTEQNLYEKNNPYQERPVPRPYFRTNLNFRSPSEFGLLGEWNLNVLATWKAGVVFTYNPANLPGVRDNVQYKDYYNVDLRLSKNFAVKRFNMEFFIDVSNVFNTKIFSSAGFSDYNDRIAYMESLHFDWEKDTQHGHDRVGESRQQGVEYIPMQETADINLIEEPETRVLYYDQVTQHYMQFDGDQWVERSKKWVRKEVLDTKAYIDMPNLTYFTFLNPLNFTIGIKFYF